MNATEPIDLRAKISRLITLLRRSNEGKYFGGGPFEVRCGDCNRERGEGHRSECLVGEIENALEEEQELNDWQEQTAAPNPRGLPNYLVSAIISADRCPMCLEDLVSGWECNECGYDAKPWIMQSKAKHDRAWDNREG